MGTRRHPDQDIDADFDEHAVVSTGREDEAAGVKAVMVSLQRGLTQMGPVRTAAALPGSISGMVSTAPAAPGPRNRAAASWPSSARTAPRPSPRRPPSAPSPRTSSPVIRSPNWPTNPSTGCPSRAGSPIRWCCAPATTTTAPISWDESYRLIAEHLNALASPDEALFYTSGRTSNEAAFLYQLLVRSFGTNNLPDCSNMCHESSGTALVDVHRHRQGLGDGAGRRTRRLHPDRRAEPRHQPSRACSRCWRRPRPTARRSSPSTRCPRPA